MPKAQLEAVVVNKTARNVNQESVELALFDSTGAALIAGKLVAARADIAALTSAAAAGSTPTKAEFDKVVADLGTIRTAVNDLLAKMRTAGILAP